uniref:Capsid protein n=1 Tax=Cygnus columbianus Chaphamaparvovirus TaxID=2794486 RepID=A0A8A4XDQ8_9VIRU|nr:MAG: capsid protein [Cygnus columbianus Chaphamaparvovirus]
MADDVSFSHCYLAYISNAIYELPTQASPTFARSSLINTGWHILPNYLWKHFITPKDWIYLMHRYEAYLVTGTRITLFNMIPMAYQLAIQATTTFTSFNNCIYAWGYTDDVYETSYHNWLTNEADNPPLFYPEGLRCTIKQSTRTRYNLPLYQYRPPLFHLPSNNTFSWDNANGVGIFPVNETPTGVVWNPLNRPEELQEYRPGKNSMTFSWSPHDCDAGKWINLDQMAYMTPCPVYGPYALKNRPGAFQMTDQVDPDFFCSRYQGNQWENDYTLPNLADQPLVPHAYFWKELQQSIINQNSTTKPNNANQAMKPNLYYPGTEYSLWKYGPNQHFTKLVPIIDSNNTNIAFSAQTAVKVELNLKCKKRRSAFFCPTDGPYSAQQMYSANLEKIVFTPSYIRARSGGARILWQNLTDTTGTTNDGHYRIDPYSSSTTVGAGPGVGGTRSAFTSTYTQAEPTELRVTFSKENDRVVIEQPQAPKRKTNKIIEAMDTQHPFWSEHTQK